MEDAKWAGSFRKSRKSAEGHRDEECLESHYHPEETRHKEEEYETIPVL